MSDWISSARDMTSFKLNAFSLLFFTSNISFVSIPEHTPFYVQTHQEKGWTFLVGSSMCSAVLVPIKSQRCKVQPSSHARDVTHAWRHHLFWWHNFWWQHFLVTHFLVTHFLVTNFWVTNFLVTNIFVTYFLVTFFVIFYAHCACANQKHFMMDLDYIEYSESEYDIRFDPRRSESRNTHCACANPQKCYDGFRLYRVPRVRIWY
jgi:hypothetical protein